MDTNEYADKIVTLFFEAGAKVSKFDFDKVVAILTQVRQEERERVVEIIEECGHQQDDDTIWCNMDELIKRINATLPTEGEKPKCSCDGVTSACSDCPPKPSV